MVFVVVRVLDNYILNGYDLFYLYKFSILRYFYSNEIYLFYMHVLFCQFSFLTLSNPKFSSCDFYVGMFGITWRGDYHHQEQRIMVILKFSNKFLFSSLHISQIDDWQISKQVHEVHQCIAHHTRVVILLILTIRHFESYWIWKWSPWKNQI